MRKLALKLAWWLFVLIVTALFLSGMVFFGNEVYVARDVQHRVGALVGMAVFTLFGLLFAIMGLTE